MKTRGIALTFTLREFHRTRYQEEGVIGGGGEGVTGPHTVLHWPGGGNSSSCSSRTSLELCAVYIAGGAPVRLRRCQTRCCKIDVRCRSQFTLGCRCCEQQRAWWMTFLLRQFDFVLRHCMHVVLQF
ncbi:hypothetical protein BaRGS_00037926 [Batillaria attramentaria]|uniref:Uncharacterized protein n=1 Tax=Batillaria attramentaria TaxID=370345 RepID=A0ABD0J7D8_9CAEN